MGISVTTMIDHTHLHARTSTYIHTYHFLVIAINLQNVNVTIEKYRIRSEMEIVQKLIYRYHLNLHN